MAVTNRPRTRLDKVSRKTPGLAATGDVAGAARALGYEDLTRFLVQRLELRQELDAVRKSLSSPPDGDFECRLLRRKIVNADLRRVVNHALKGLLSVGTVECTPRLAVFKTPEFVRDVTHHILSWRGSFAPSHLASCIQKSGDRGAAWMPSARRYAIDVALRIAALDRALPGLEILDEFERWVDNESRAPFYSQVRSRCAAGASRTQSASRHDRGGVRPSRATVEALLVSAPARVALRLALLVDGLTECLAVVGIASSGGDDRGIVRSAVVLARLVRDRLNAPEFEDDPSSGTPNARVLEFIADGERAPKAFRIKHALQLVVRSPILALELEEYAPDWALVPGIVAAARALPSTGRPPTGLDRGKVTRVLALIDEGLLRFDVSLCASEDDRRARDGEIAMIRSISAAGERHVPRAPSNQGWVSGGMRAILSMPLATRRKVLEFLTERSAPESTDHIDGDELDRDLAAFFSARPDLDVTMKRRRRR